jgi:hypothetical protein
LREEPVTLTLHIAHQRVTDPIDRSHFSKCQQSAKEAFKERGFVTIPETFFTLKKNKEDYLEDGKIKGGGFFRFDKTVASFDVLLKGEADLLQRKGVACPYNLKSMTESFLNIPLTLSKKELSQLCRFEVSVSVEEWPLPTEFSAKEKSNVSLAHLVSTDDLPGLWIDGQGSLHVFYEMNLHSYSKNDTLALKAGRESRSLYEKQTEKKLAEWKKPS